MTIREKIDKWNRILGFLNFPLAFSAVALICCFNGKGIASNTVMLGLVAFCSVLAVFRLMWFDKRNCPKCDNNIGRLGYLKSSKWGVKMDENIKFCPYCGIDLDTEIESLDSSSCEPIFQSHKNEMN